MNVAENISNFEEGGTNHCKYSNCGDRCSTQPTQLASAGQVEKPSSVNSIYWF